MRVWQKQTRVVGFMFAVVLSMLLTQSSLTVGPRAASAQSAGTHVFLPIIMKQQLPFARSHYMVISKPDFNPYTLGQADAQEHQLIIQEGKRLMYVLAWGQPCISGNTIGVYSYDALG